MSKKVQPRPWEAVEEGESPKRARFDRCFSGIEFRMEAKPLKELDPENLKKEIKRWAKAVVTYARQLSGSFSSRERSGSFSSREVSSGSSKNHKGSLDRTSMLTCAEGGTKAE